MKKILLLATLLAPYTVFADVYFCKANAYSLIDITGRAVTDKDAGRLGRLHTYIVNTDLGLRNAGWLDDPNYYGECESIYTEDKTLMRCIWENSSNTRIINIDLGETMRLPFTFSSDTYDQVISMVGYCVKA